MTCWPSCVESCCASGRAKASVPPPAGNGETRRTGLLGHACASTSAGRAAAMANRARRTHDRRDMALLLEKKRNRAVTPRHSSRGRPAPCFSASVHQGPRDGSARGFIAVDSRRPWAFRPPQCRLRRPLHCEALRNCAGFRRVSRGTRGFHPRGIHRRMPGGPPCNELARNRTTHRHPYGPSAGWRHRSCSPRHSRSLFPRRRGRWTRSRTGASAPRST